LSNFFFSKKPGICSFLTLFYDSRYPLIDGTFFLSPRQHTKACIQVKFITSVANLDPSDPYVFGLLDPDPSIIKQK
jgi:hypothetical protein